MTNRDRIQTLLLAVSGLAFIPFAEWLTVTPVGTSFLLWMSLGYGFVCVGAVIAIPVFAVRLIAYQDTSDSVFYLVISFLAVGTTILGLGVGRSIRMNGMHAFAQRSKPLIAAIVQYEKDTGSPPPSLASLVPKYLPAVPSTGMMAYPEYHYKTGGTTSTVYGGNQWVLVVDTPSGGINFDEMLYFPNQIYPKQGYGGSLEPVGSWAYVHE